MPISQDTYNKNLYDLLSVRYDVTPINSKGQTTPVPQEADVFRFEFTKNGKGYGDVWITVDNGKNLVVYYDDQVADSGEENTSGTGTPDTWTHLVKQLKHWARTNLLSFELKNRNHLSKDMAQREHMKKKEKLGEGYYPMGKKASYSDNVPKVKIILQHTRQLEEGEQRFRNIQKIFVENANGERFAIPTNRPGLARVYARHIAEGGTPYDDKGKHITSLVEEYSKMAGFVRATKNGQFNEDAQQLVNVGINHYKTMKETLTRMVTGRGYNKYFENWTPVLNEESESEDNLNELFVRETLDPRIESVMPILSKLKKQLKEMDEVKSLDEWAENTINEKLEVDVKTDESTRKHFKQVADVISQHPHSHKRDELAKHHAEIFSKQNPRFDRKKFFAAAKALDASEKKDNVKEETKVRYEVRDKDGSRLGTWDGMQFKSYDTTKHKHGNMIPTGSEVDKSSGPLDQKTDAMVAAGIKEEQMDEATKKYFHIVVDGVSKGKYTEAKKAKDLADAMRKEFPDKKIEVEVKDEMTEELTQEDTQEFAGHYKTGEEGQWRNKGPKANKPAERGDLVGESEMAILKTLSGIK